jgi:hypothetical protein
VVGAAGTLDPASNLGKSSPRVLVALCGDIGAPALRVGFANSGAASTLSFLSRSARARLGLFVDEEVVLDLIVALLTMPWSVFGASIGETIERA